MKDCEFGERNIYQIHNAWILYFPTIWQMICKNKLPNIYVKYISATHLIFSQFLLFVKVFWLMKSGKAAYSCPSIRSKNFRAVWLNNLVAKLVGYWSNKMKKFHLYIHTLTVFIFSISSIFSIQNTDKLLIYGHDHENERVKILLGFATRETGWS